MAIKDLTENLQEKWAKRIIDDQKEDKKQPMQEAEVQLSTPKKVQIEETKAPRHQTTKPLSHHDTVVSGNQDGKQPINQATSTLYSQELVEKLRAMVKQLGREPATYRMTFEEKKALRGIEYDYSNRDIRTNSNELVRIAVNFLLEDYYANKEKSLLAHVLESLNK
jgi:hypothetical protein